MRYLVLVIVSLALVTTALAQRNAPPYYSLGGYGNVLYPGTGHAPAAPAAGFSNASRVPRPGGGGVVNRPGPISHPTNHSRTVIVPYPVYYGGFIGNGYEPAAENQNTYQEQDPNYNGAPPVVINQTFVAPQSAPMVREYSGDASQDQSSMHLYQAPPSHPYADAAEAPPRRTANTDQPTIYLIAFNDHSVVQALGFWMEGGNLHYVSVEHSLNQASLDLIDRDLSQRLNTERGLEFKLPAK